MKFFQCKVGMFVEHIANGRIGKIVALHPPPVLRIEIRFVINGRLEKVSDERFPPAEYHPLNHPVDITDESE